MVPENVRDWSLNSLNDICLHSQYSRGILSTEEKEGLIILYSQLYSVSVASIDLNSSYLQYKKIGLHGKHIGTSMDWSKSTSIVMAQWHHSFASNSYNAVIEEWPAQINYFIKHIIKVSNTSVTVLLFSALQ